MAFEGLSDKLNAVFKRLKARGKLKESDIKEVMREVRLALLEADVNYKVTKDFVAAVSERAVGSEVLESLTPAQQVIKIVKDEMTALMGSENVRVRFSNRLPTILMMCGLQGSGKTTHCAKLAKYFKSQGKRPLLVACDVYRPAAIKQLQVVGEQVGVPVFEMGQGDPVEIARRAIMRAKDHGDDLVILDTAGRLHVDEQLMEELTRIKETVGPHEILLVVDATTGQNALAQARRKPLMSGSTSAASSSPSSTAIPAAARRSRSARSPASRSSLSVSANGSTSSKRSIRTVWPPESSGWATCSPSSKRLRTRWTKKRPRPSRRSCAKPRLP